MKRLVSCFILSICLMALSCGKKPEPKPTVKFYRIIQVDKSGKKTVLQDVNGNSVMKVNP